MSDGHFLFLVFMCSFVPTGWSWRLWVPPVRAKLPWSAALFLFTASCNLWFLGSRYGIAESVLRSLVIGGLQGAAGWAFWHFGMRKHR